MATVAPDGTEFAREFRAFAREVQTNTRDAVTVRWYFGGIAGDEMQVRDRIDRGQLDGTASGGMLCAQLSPTMRAMRVGTMVISSAEASYLLGRLRSDIAADFTAGGFEGLGTPLLGADLLFLKQPVSSMPELHKLRVLRWDLDTTGIESMRTVGMQVVPATLDGFNPELDAGHADGFVGIATGALAFQWSLRAKVLLRLPVGYLAGCLLVSQRSWNRLPVDAREAIRAAAAKAMRRMDDLMERQNALLLGGLFQRQGLRVIEPSPSLREQYYSAMREARGQIAQKLVPIAILDRIRLLMADFRAEH
jgi:TRAP-type C4-dicarboxylate transport system substrate-binding protein